MYIETLNSVFLLVRTVCEFSMLPLVTNIAFILVQLFFRDYHSFTSRKLCSDKKKERLRERKGNSKCKNAVTKRIGVMWAHQPQVTLTCFFFFLDRSHSFSCKIFQNLTNFKKAKNTHSVLASMPFLKGALQKSLSYGPSWCRSKPKTAQIWTCAFVPNGSTLQISHWMLRYLE